MEKVDQRPMPDVRRWKNGESARLTDRAMLVGELASNDVSRVLVAPRAFAAYERGT